MRRNERFKTVRKAWLPRFESVAAAQVGKSLPRKWVPYLLCGHSDDKKDYYLRALGVYMESYNSVNC